jgi:hypothetical protein
LKCKQSSKNRGKPPIVPRLGDAICGSSASKAQPEISDKQLASLRRNMNALQMVYVRMGKLKFPLDISPDTQKLLTELVKCAYEVGNHPSLKAVLVHSKMHQQEWESVHSAIYKVGRYYSASGFLICAAQKLRIFRNIVIETLSPPAEMPPIDGINDRRVSVSDLLDGLFPTLSNKKKQALKKSGYAIIGREPARADAAVSEPLSHNYRVHAEVQLVIHYAQKENDGIPQPRVICASKSACFLCNLFLKYDGQFYTPKTHGRLYAQWTIPRNNNAPVPTALAKRFGQVLEQTQEVVVGEIKKALELGKVTVNDPHESVLAPSARWSSPNHSPLGLRDDDYQGCAPSPDTPRASRFLESDEGYRSSKQSSRTSIQTVFPEELLQAPVKQDLANPDELVVSAGISPKIHPLSESPTQPQDKLMVSKDASRHFDPENKPSELRDNFVGAYQPSPGPARSVMDFGKLAAPKEPPVPKPVHSEHEFVVTDQITSTSGSPRFMTDSGNPAAPSDSPPFNDSHTEPENNPPPPRNNFAAEDRLPIPGSQPVPIESPSTQALRSEPETNPTASKGEFAPADRLPPISSSPHFVPDSGKLAVPRESTTPNAFHLGPEPNFPVSRDNSTAAGSVLPISASPPALADSGKLTVPRESLPPNALPAHGLSTRPLAIIDAFLNRTGNTQPAPDVSPRATTPSLDDITPDVRSASPPDSPLKSPLIPASTLNTARAKDITQPSPESILALPVPLSLPPTTQPLSLERGIPVYSELHPSSSGLRILTRRIHATIYSETRCWVRLKYLLPNERPRMSPGAKNIVMVSRMGWGEERTAEHGVAYGRTNLYLRNKGDIVEAKYEFGDFDDEIG